MYYCRLKIFTADVSKSFSPSVVGREPRTRPHGLSKPSGFVRTVAK